MDIEIAPAWLRKTLAVLIVAPYVVIRSAFEITGELLREIWRS